jgi:hypothetical protein
MAAITIAINPGQNPSGILQRISIAMPAERWSV